MCVSPVHARGCEDEVQEQSDILIRQLEVLTDRRPVLME